MADITRRIPNRTELLWATAFFDSIAMIGGPSQVFNPGTVTINPLPLWLAGLASFVIFTDVTQAGGSSVSEPRFRYLDPLTGVPIAGATGSIPFTGGPVNGTGALQRPKWEWGNIQTTLSDVPILFNIEVVVTTSAATYANVRMWASAAR